MTHTTTTTIERGHVLATCSCGWIRSAPDETTARLYAGKHVPRPGKEG